MIVGKTLTNKESGVNTRDDVECPCGPDCSCGQKIRRLQGHKTWLWVVMILLGGLVIGMIFDLTATQRQLERTRQQLSEMKTDITALRASVNAEVVASAAQARADTVNFKQLRATTGAAVAAGRATQASIDSLTPQIAGLETRVRSLELAQQRSPTKSELTGIIKMAVDPAIINLDSQLATVTARADALDQALNEQRARTDMIARKAETSAVEKVWRSVVTTVAVTGLFTGVR